MGLLSIVFPKDSRHFFGKRWLNVLLRSVHLCSASGYAGGFLFDVPAEQLQPLYIITALTGLVMILFDVFSNGIWLIQNRGWMIILKVILLGQLALIDPYQKWGIFIIILLSGIVSHGTAGFRYYSIFHRRMVEKL